MANPSYSKGPLKRFTDPTTSIDGQNADPRKKRCDDGCDELNDEMDMEGAGQGESDFGIPSDNIPEYDGRVPSSSGGGGGGGGTTCKCTCRGGG